MGWGLAQTTPYFYYTKKTHSRREWNQIELGYLTEEQRESQRARDKYLQYLYKGQELGKEQEVNSFQLLRSVVAMSYTVPISSGFPAPYCPGWTAELDSRLLSYPRRNLLSTLGALSPDLLRCHLERLATGINNGLEVV